MTFTSDTWCDFLSCPVQSQGTDLMTVLGPSQLQRSYESIHRDFLKGSHQAPHCGSWSHWVAQVRGKILAQLNVFSWRGDQNMWQIFFLESSAERSPPQGLCYQMCYIKDLKEEGISEVKFAGETIQEVKQRTNLKNLTVLSNCSVKKQQMKCSTDHCRVNHRHKIHLTSFNKIKGFELITEFREKLLGL